MVRVKFLSSFERSLEKKKKGSKRRKDKYREFTYKILALEANSWNDCVWG